MVMVVMVVMIIVTAEIRPRHYPEKAVMMVMVMVVVIVVLCQLHRLLLHHASRHSGVVHLQRV